MAQLSVKFLALFLVTLTLATIISARAFRTHKIEVGSNGNSFSPEKVTVRVGDRVRFTVTNGFHSVILSDEPGTCNKSTKLNNSEIIKQTAVAGTEGTFVINKDTPSVLGFFCDKKVMKS
ncbi:5410_t:CDS:2 [Cetraspora pellucida]|uniref:5410_t:CDS:1 n=1 Tax=Cetraspora pellucida TaxID=1433469 RepID=A0A9N9AUE2_9GLOM|nr:5410_t:CDS:2 [Cetraspora pellucida]